MDINNCINWINSINETKISKIDDLLNGDILLEIIGKILNKDKDKLLEYLEDSYSKIMLSNVSNLVDTFFEYEFNFLSQGEQLHNNIIELVNFLKSKYIDNQKNNPLKIEIKDNNIDVLNEKQAPKNNFFFSNKNYNNNTSDNFKKNLSATNKNYISSENTINLHIDANYPNKNMQKNIIINYLYPENSKKIYRNSNNLYSADLLAQCNNNLMSNNLRNKLLSKTKSLKDIDKYKIDIKNIASLDNNFKNNFLNEKTMPYNTDKEKYYSSSRNKKQISNNSIQLKKNPVNNDDIDNNVYQDMNKDNSKYNYYNSFLSSNKKIINKANSKIERINLRKNNTSAYQIIKLDKHPKKYKTKINTFYSNLNANNQNPLNNNNCSSLISNKMSKTIGIPKNNSENFALNHNFIKPSKTIFSLNDNKYKKLKYESNESKKTSIDENFNKSKKETFILNSLYNLGLIEFKNKNNKYLYNFILPNLNNKILINAIKEYYSNKYKILNSTNQNKVNMLFNIEEQLNYLYELFSFYRNINNESKSAKNIFEIKNIVKTNENKKIIKKIKLPLLPVTNFNHNRKKFIKKIIPHERRIKNSLSVNQNNNIINNNDKPRNITFKELLNIRKKIAYNHFG